MTTFKNDGNLAIAAHKWMQEKYEPDTPVSNISLADLKEMIHSLVSIPSLNRDMYFEPLPFTIPDDYDLSINFSDVKDILSGQRISVEALREKMGCFVTMGQAKTTTQRELCRLVEEMIMAFAKVAIRIPGGTLSTKAFQNKIVNQNNKPLLTPEQWERICSGQKVKTREGYEVSIVGYESISLERCLCIDFKKPETGEEIRQIYHKKQIDVVAVWFDIRHQRERAINTYFKKCFRSMKLGEIRSLGIGNGGSNLLKEAVKLIENWCNADFDTAWLNVKSGKSFDDIAEAVDNLLTDIC